MQNGWIAKLSTRVKYGIFKDKKYESLGVVAVVIIVPVYIFTCIHLIYIIYLHVCICIYFLSFVTVEMNFSAQTVFLSQRQNRAGYINNEKPGWKL